MHGLSVGSKSTWQVDKIVTTALSYPTVLCTVHGLGCSRLVLGVAQRPRVWAQGLQNVGAAGVFGV